MKLKVIEKMDSTGHTTFDLTAADEKLLKEAEQIVTDHLKKGGLAYGLDAAAMEGELVDSFDKAKEFERVILSPQMAGG